MRDWANEDNKENFAQIFLHLTEGFLKQQTLSYFTKTIIRPRLSECQGGDISLDEYSPDIHFPLVSIPMSRVIQIK